MSKVKNKDIVCKMKSLTNISVSKKRVRGKGKFDHQVGENILATIAIMGIMFASSKEKPLNFTKVIKKLENNCIVQDSKTVRSKCRSVLEYFEDDFKIVTRSINAKFGDGDFAKVNQIREFYCKNKSAFIDEFNDCA